MKKFFLSFLLLIFCGFCYAQMQYTFPLKTTTFPLSEETDIDALMQNLQTYFEGQQNCHIVISAGKTHKIMGRFSSSVFYKKGWVWILFDASCEGNELIVKYDAGSKKKNVSKLFKGAIYTDKQNQIERIVDNMNAEINEMTKNY